MLCCLVVHIYRVNIQPILNHVFISSKPTRLRIFFLFYVGERFKDIFVISSPSLLSLCILSLNQTPPQLSLPQLDLFSPSLSLPKRSLPVPSTSSIICPKPVMSLHRSPKHPLNSLSLSQPSTSSTISIYSLHLFSLFNYVSQPSTLSTMSLFKFISLPNPTFTLSLPFSSFGIFL